MSRPLVSIIIPSYNTAPYVREAVDSALAQTYKNCEVIVVDDGSTDATKEILAPYIAKQKIVYIYQKNKGLAGARNTGIRAAKGDYIALLDSDDLFLPEKISRQVEALEARPDCGACYSDLMHFTDPPAGETARVLYHHRYRYPSGNIFEPLLHKQFLNPLATVFRKEIFAKYGFFDENLRRSEDWEFWLRIAHAGVKFYYLDEALAEYRMRGTGNLSAIESEPEMKEKNLKIFSALGMKLTKEEWERYRFADILKRLTVKTAFAYLMVGDKKMALARAAGLPAYWRFLISLLPGSAWKRILGGGRRKKQRAPP